MYFRLLKYLSIPRHCVRLTSFQHHRRTGAELLEKWKEVVDEATAMRRLKSILVYRRKAADMRETAKENSGEHKSHRRALDLNNAFEALAKCAAKSNQHANRPMLGTASPLLSSLSAVAYILAS